jgi:hypothetical protein
MKDMFAAVMVGIPLLLAQIQRLAVRIDCDAAVYIRDQSVITTFRNGQRDAVARLDAERRIGLPGGHLQGRIVGCDQRLDRLGPGWMLRDEILAVAPADQQISMAVKIAPQFGAEREEGRAVEQQRRVPAVLNQMDRKGVSSAGRSARPGTFAQPV